MSARRFSAILALATVGLAGQPPKLINIYQTRFDASLPPVPSGFVRMMSSFAFSPDEKWMAVVAGGYSTDARAAVTHLPGTLLVLPVHASQRQPVHISPGMATGAAYWSPDSGSLAVQAIPARWQDWDAGTGITRLYDPGGQLLWTGPPSGTLAGFIEPGRLLAQHWRKKGSFSGFDTIDVRTSAVTAWPASRAVSRHWSLAAIDSESGLVAVFPNQDRSRTLIVDYQTGKVRQSIKNQVNTIGLRTGAPSIYFAEHGRVVCSAAMPYQFFNSPICREVETGKTLAELKPIDGGEPADASASGSRMVVTKQDGLSYRGNVVWDFRSGAEIAAWAPSLPQQQGSRRIAPEPFAPPAVAISASGRYVATLFREEVRIYELPGS